MFSCIHPAGLEHCGKAFASSASAIDHHSYLSSLPTKRPSQLGLIMWLSHCENGFDQADCEPFVPVFWSEVVFGLEKPLLKSRLQSLENSLILRDMYLYMYLPSHQCKAGNARTRTFPFPSPSRNMQHENDQAYHNTQLHHRTRTPIHHLHQPHRASSAPASPQTTTRAAIHRIRILQTLLGNGPIRLFTCHRLNESRKRHFAVPKVGLMKRTVPFGLQSSSNRVKNSHCRKPKLPQQDSLSVRDPRTTILTTDMVYRPAYSKSSVTIVSSACFFALSSVNAEGSEKLSSARPHHPWRGDIVLKGFLVLVNRNL